LTSIDVISIADVLIHMSNVTSVSETITVSLKYVHISSLNKNSTNSQKQNKVEIWKKGLNRL
jgi:hypothetical protein